MTSVRPDGPPESYSGDDLTYPTLVGHHIRECTGNQRRNLKERQMSIEERVSRIERILMDEGKL